MVVDKDKALAVLEAEAKLASTEPVDGPWVARVRAVVDRCKSGPRTHIAMLGTGFLAKATNPKVDTLTLKTASGGAGAYSARSLAKDVLAAHAPRLGIDLGVSGREPLNNQPYFRSATLDEALEVVRGDGRAALQAVIEALTAVNKVDAAEARLALRAFIQERRVTRQAHPVPTSARFPSLDSAVSAIQSWVAANSEGGKRAQAAVAAVFDAYIDWGTVESKRVNDPDRHLPGDVILWADLSNDRPFEALEVRDKPVTREDAFHFILKVREKLPCRVGVIGVHEDQRDFSENPELVRFAVDHEVVFHLYPSWSKVFEAALRLASVPTQHVLTALPQEVVRRLEELEVSEGGAKEWLALVQAASGGAG